MIYLYVHRKCRICTPFWAQKPSLLLLEVVFADEAARAEVGPDVPEDKEEHPAHEELQEEALMFDHHPLEPQKRVDRHVATHKEPIYIKSPNIILI